MKNPSQNFAPSTPCHTAGALHLEADGVNAVRGCRAGIALRAPPPHA